LATSISAKVPVLIFGRVASMATTIVETAETRNMIVGIVK
jgi:ATP-dependent protease ClpP protease subunit